MNHLQRLPSGGEAWEEGYGGQYDQYRVENCPRPVGSHVGPSLPSPGVVGEEAPRLRHLMQPQNFREG